MTGIKICLGVPGTPCVERTRSPGGRCRLCEQEFQRRRNKTRLLYQGSHKRHSIAQRKAQPWCSICGTTVDLCWDHEHGQVECRPCNSSHRRDAS